MAKYTHKCPCCNRKATKKLMGVYFCENCYKECKRYKPRYVFGERIVWVIPNIFGGKPLAVYTDIPIKLYAR